MFDFNSIIAISLSVLAFFSFCIVLIVFPIALQLYKTLNSLQLLLDTINDDLEPAVSDIKEGVDSVKSVLKKGTNVFRQGFQESNILMTSSAYGVLAAVKDYLKSCKKSETSYNNKR